MKSCSSGKKEFNRSSACPKAGPLSKSPRMTSFVKSNRRGEDELCSENVSSPPSKSRRISIVKKMKIKTQFPSNENEVLIEKPGAYGGLLGACKELANLAIARGSLDDITVMIVDLNHFRG